MNKKYIVLQGIKGGVGCTTVTANLAVALQNIGWNTIVVELSPQNDLKLHFNGQFADPNGLFRSFNDKTPWHETGYQDQNGVVFFPFGLVNTTCANNIVNRMQRGYLSQLIDQIEGEDDTTIVLIDAPHYDDSYNKLFSDIDNHFLVLNTDAVSYALFMAKKHHFKSMTSHVVLNRFNPSHALETEVHTLLHAHLPQNGCAIAGVISKNEMVAEAIAQNSNIVNILPESITAKEFHFLAMQICRQSTGPGAKSQTDHANKDERINMVDEWQK